MQETDDSDGHVVAANASSVTVRCQAVVHHVLAYGLQRLLRHDPAPNELYNSLRGLAVPDTCGGPLALLGSHDAGILTIACNDKEFVILVDIMYLDIWKRGDYLLLGREICALLELEVAYRTRQGEVAVHATKVDETACSLDTRFLG